MRPLGGKQPLSHDLYAYVLHYSPPANRYWENADTLLLRLELTSEVICDSGATEHIPLLDFHCPISSSNRNLVAEVAKRLLPGGAIILESGDSYHVYGRKTVSSAALTCLLAKSLLFSPIVDRAYIAHQLIEGRCALRISAGGQKRLVPTVVAVI
jgi:hypothetical protein